MYFISKDEKLTPMKIGEILQAFQTRELPNLQKHKNYYDGKQAILQKTVNDETKPNNRLISNFCDNIVTTYAGYLTGIDITYSSDEDITEVQDVLNYNDVASEDSALLTDALVYGVAYEIM